MERSMARRSSASPLLAILLIAVLAAGCVKQPVDEAQLPQGDGAGVVAAPLAADEAEQLAADDSPAKQRKRQRRQRRAAKQAAQSDQPAAAAAASTAAAGGSDVTKSSDDAAAPGPAANAAFAEVLAFDDRPGDASGEAPPYGDIQRVVVQSNGTIARVSVVFAGDLPPALADGEVQGVGVDFYRSEGRESDYQLFADGGYKGWRAFLHTPDGVVSFPGAFRVGGSAMVFEVPWSALGGKKAAGLTVFSDWSQKRTLLNAVGNDRAPNSGRATVRPAQV
jgi:hypothetical protein